MKYLCLVILVLSLSFTGYTMPAVCDSPANAALNNITSHSAIFSWDAVTGATQYEYYISTSTSMPATPGTVMANTSVQAMSMAANTTYYFCVRTKCGTAYSSWVCIPGTTLPKTSASVNTVEKTTLVNVFPNPATNTLTFESPAKGASIRIMNVIGKVMYTVTMNTNKQSVDISQWPSGIYLVKCMSNNDSYTIKVVKE